MVTLGEDVSQMFQQINDTNFILYILKYFTVIIHKFRYLSIMACFLPKYTFLYVSVMYLNGKFLLIESIERYV